MDPLSVASGVAGLVTLADVVISRTYNTIIACKHASEDSRKLLREAQALLGILQSLASLETKLGAAALTSQIPAAQVLACQQTLQNIRDKLEKSDPKEDGISVFQKAKRTLKWPLSSSETEKFLSEMERHKSTFDLALSADALNAILSSHHAGERTDVKIDSIANSVNKLCKIENTQEDRRLLQMIGAEDADDTYQANLKLHQHGTGLWFLEEGKPFSTWLSTLGSKLWVYGIPGAGKTILSVLAISKTAELMSSNHGVMFYYCNHANEESRRSAGVLRCLVGQLARQNRQCMNMLEAKFKHHEHTSAQTWTRNDKELEMMLRKMTRQFGSVSIIIDGVDECHEAAAVTDTLASLAGETPGVRTLIFSRKEADMVPFLEDYVQMSIAAESQDLRLFVPAEIESRTRFRKLRIKDPSVKDEIIETLVNGADGMFRWVVCQLDHLCDLTTDAERLSALKQLPRTLESTYDRILERVLDRGESICKLVQRSLIWIIDGGISTQQLCEAVCIDSQATSMDPRKLIDAEDILLSCSSLIRVSADSRRLESAHFTVVEYLEGLDPISQPHLARFHFCHDNAYQYMAEISLTALTFDNVTIDVMKDPASFSHWICGVPFYSYAARYWWSFARHCQRTASIAALTTKLFLGPTPDYYHVWAHAFLLDWSMICRDMDSLVWSYTSLVDLGLHTEIRQEGAAILGRDICTDCEHSLFATSHWTRALATAAMLGKLRLAALIHQHQILGKIVDSPADLNDAGSVGTALHMSMLQCSLFDIQWKQRELNEIDDLRRRHDISSLTVKTLVDLGADMNVKFPLPDGREVSTTLIACMTGHRKEVFAAGAPIDGITADWLYMYGEKEELASICPINFDQVAEGDRPAVIRLLQKLGQSSEIAGSQLNLEATSVTDEQNEVLPGYVRVLDEACENDDLLIVRWFLEYSKISVNQLIDDETILHKACFWSSVSVVEYLILKGAQVDKLDTYGDRPLRCLFGYDRKPLPFISTIMKSLLNAGANINSLDEDNNSGLLCWARMPYSDEWRAQLQDILDVIISSQADLFRSNNAGESVWHVLAANQDGYRLSEMLGATSSQKDTRATFDGLDRTGCTALHIATSNCHGQMMQLLMDLGSSLTKRTPDGQTILDLAVANLNRSHIPFRTALDAGCQFSNERPHDFLSKDITPNPICAIVSSGDLDRLKSFVAAGGNLELPFEQCGCTPVMTALTSRQVASVEYLLSLRVKLCTTFCWYHYPQGLSALGLLASQPNMFKQLQSTFDSVDGFNWNDFNAMIHSAAANGNLEALRLMLAEERRVEPVRSGWQRNVLVYLFDQNHWMSTTGTPLHTAVRSGQCESVQILLTDGFDPDAVDSAMVPCSHYAAQQGDDAMLELLLSHGATVDSRDGNMLTTLGLALSIGHMNAVRLLSSRGADLSVRDYRDWTLFQIAVASQTPSTFFWLIDAGLPPTLQDIIAWCAAGYKQIWMARDHMQQLVIMSDVLCFGMGGPAARAMSRLMTPHYRKLSLTRRCRFSDVQITSLYRAATAGLLAFVKILHCADAMLNLEGGMEGTPLMGACKTGRLDVVKYLVRNGAILSYRKHGMQVNAFNEAACYPRIQRWLLVERFTEQRMIAAGSSAGKEHITAPAESATKQEVDVREEDTYTYADDIADVTLDLVLEDEVEKYLESKNWFLPMRRFIDDGAGAFERVPIMPGDFARYRPLGFKTSLA